MRVGIEAINFYGGPTFISIKDIFKARNLNFERFDNLLIDKKSVGLPCEDPVSYGVNAAKPIIDNLSEEERNSIQLLITSSESGLDFGKSMSTYIHDYLGLSRKCRMFEVKQACYGGTCALQMATCYIASNVAPGAKALVVATDIARAAAKNTYAEPSQAVGAIAMLVSTKPKVFEMDLGATGHHSYEVMDTCRPLPEIEVGDPDLSLLSYLDCLSNSFKHYMEKVEDVDIMKTFDYFAFHTPFGGMVKGGHRKILREFAKIGGKAAEEDFAKRMEPSLKYCRQVGNVYSATAYLALCGIIDSEEYDTEKRVGIFSYGSGCSSEFYSGLISPESKHELYRMDIQGHLAARYELNMEEYDKLLDLNSEWTFGVRGKKVDISQYEDIYNYFFAGKNYLVLDEVEDNFHRKYKWS